MCFRIYITSRKKKNIRTELKEHSTCDIILLRIMTSGFTFFIIIVCSKMSEWSTIHLEI